MIPPDYEKRIGHAFQQALILCLCALLPPLFSLTGFFRPEDEPLGLWFQRSGIVMTVLAVLAHFKAAGIATTMIAGGTFAETWEAFHKYNRFQTLAAWLSLILIVIGTVIWAYGDLLFPEPPDDSEEQTAASALVGRFPQQAYVSRALLGFATAILTKLSFFLVSGHSVTLPRWMAIVPGPQPFLPVGLGSPVLAW
jgi:hypothetical protein